jgi:AcrR family transcriptional regulator
VGAPATRKPLSRARVLAAAVELADTEGLASVTMRRLATALGVEAMSLYHHLSGKDALLDGLIDTVVSEFDTAIGHLEETERPQDWRTTLRRRFLTARRVMLRHPWAPALIGSRTTIPVSVYGHYEAILATLIEGGFSYHLAHRALHAFGSMPLGFVQELFSPASAGDDTDAEVAEAQLAQLAEALPHLTAMVTSEIHESDEGTLGWCDSQAEFEFTLDLLLDGLARHLE